MFLYYHSLQTENNSKYYKGILFENLLKQYFDAVGYDVELRKKHNSLEYDIEGNDRAAGFRIIGEAKAHDNSISAPTFTSFVGKLLPLGLFEGKIKGIFLSTAALTSEAEDYYNKVCSYGIIKRTSKNLYTAIIDELNLPNSKPLIQQIEEKGYIFQDTHLLTTDNGIFVVVTAGSSEIVTPAYFAVFDKTGKLISDEKFLFKLSNSISELNALEPIIDRKELVTRDERIIPKGLAVGGDWTDYRLPAGPDFFVGRREFVERILDHIYSGETTNIIQVKSRSGVGKSSILAYLENELSNSNVITELHDARDVKSVLDIFALVRRFTNSSYSPQDFSDIEHQLKEFVLINGFEKGHKRAVFIVDQFESTFISPEVFMAYETLANIFLKFNPFLYLCLARKNDQITTYDDTKISLQRINSISKSYGLNDFTQSEAAELINRINLDSEKIIGKDVLLYVLEFAQGFPWLLKRTMAHVIHLASANISPQKELFATGLRLDDLFDEELEGLDEIEREYLTRVTSRLPSDYHQLQLQFDDDPLLPKMLDKLTQARLLRLRGATYDTYNDVFKEYLLYRRLPEFRQLIIYRINPKSAIRVIQWALKQENFDVEDMENKLKLSKGSAFNHIKELGNFNLIKKDGKKWKVPRTVLDISEQGHLGEYIRRQLTDNDLISKLISRIAQSEDIFVDDIPDYLKEQAPFLEASDLTWNTYAKIFRAWLTTTKLIQITDNDKIVLPKEDRSKIIEDLGNLTKIKYTGRRSSSEFFLPLTTWPHVENAVKCILSGGWPDGCQESKAITDLKNGGWIDNDNLTIGTLEELRQQVKELLESGPYDKIWQAAENNEALLPILDKLTDQSLSERTLNWQITRLLNWAKELDIIEKRTYRHK